ncbi:MAG: type I restriction enzyme HsdR N-terminal domain-containing protein [Bacteroidales bacterium]|nr:type I restriction enzyme HsdR N-terminal domain-containing protein [Bacteroidales bacterium]
MNSPSLIYCVVRKKWVDRTPEEEIRQKLIKHLNIVCGAPLHLMVCEYPVQHLNQRADLVVHDRKGIPLVLAEFKAPSVKIDHKVIEQIRSYNAVILADYLLASNGSDTRFWRFNKTKSTYEPMEDIPSYEELLKLYRP